MQTVCTGCVSDTMGHRGRVVTQDGPRGAPAVRNTSLDSFCSKVISQTTGTYTFSTYNPCSQRTTMHSS
jgi:hypothetical protein